MKWFNPVTSLGDALVKGKDAVGSGGSWLKNMGKDVIAGMDRSKRAEALYGGGGIPKFNSQYRQYGNQIARYGDQESAFRGDQQALGHTLAQEAQGNGVGQQLVGMQVRQAANRASAQQFGAIAGARPGMQAMAARNAMLGSALAQSQVGEQAAMGSAQMTLGAQQQYSQHLQGARAGDLQQNQINNQSQLEAYRQRMEMATAAEKIRTARYNALLGSPTQMEVGMGALQGGGAAAAKMFG